MPDDEALREALLQLRADHFREEAASGAAGVRGAGGELPREGLEVAVAALLATGECAPATTEGAPHEALPLEPLAVELLADLGRALADVETGAAAAPSPSVLAAARAAFRAQAPTPVAAAPGVVPATGALAPLRVLEARRSQPWAALARAAAAALLVGLGWTWLAAPRDAEARAVVALAGVDHYALAGAGSEVSLGGRVEARPGTAFVAGRDEVLALRLGDGGRFVLRQGERLDVSALSGVELPGDASSEGGGALLTLAGGEVLLACEGGGSPAPVRLLLRVPGTGVPLGLFTLRRGAAHVAQAPGLETRPAVALADGAAAGFTPYLEGARRWGACADLRGPVEVLVGAEGAVVQGEPARHQFVDLERFGGPLLERRVEPFVSARQWRVLEGRARRVGGSLSLEPSTSGRRAVLAWRPDDSAASARVLRLQVRGPAGVSLVDPFALAGHGPQFGGFAEELLLAGSSEDPGLATVELALPSDWPALTQATAGELRLEFRWPEGVPGEVAPQGAAAALHFDGAFLGAAPVHATAGAEVSLPGQSGSGKGG